MGHLGWTTIAMLLVSTTALADATTTWQPVTRVDASPAYDTPDQAAIAAFRALAEPFADAEFGGLIVERGGRFYYSRPVSRGSSHSLGFRAQLRSDDRLVGYYHTHPAVASEDRDDAVRREYFSSADVAVARALGVVAYVAVESTRTVRMFDPAGPDARRIGRQRLVAGQAIARLRARPGES